MNIRACRRHGQNNIRIGTVADPGAGEAFVAADMDAPAIRSAISAARLRNRIVQLAVAGDTAVPVIARVDNALTLQGTRRFRHAAFAEAVACIADRRIDVAPIVTGSFPLEDAVAAFAAAGDRRTSVKVQIAFDGAA